MKKVYTEPAMQVIKLDHHCQILSGSFTSVGTNLIDTDEILYEGGGWFDAR